MIETVNKLNRDLGYQYNLTIKATDHGVPQLSATVSRGSTIYEIVKRDGLAIIIVVTR